MVTMEKANLVLVVGRTQVDPRISSLKKDGCLTTPRTMERDKKAERTTGLDAIIKPFTTNNICFHYCPILGAASYTTLSVSVLNPSLRLLFPKRDLTNILLINSLVGTGFHIYSRSHMGMAHSNTRYGYAAFGSTLFCFSSVLVWAVLRSVLPENLIVCSLAGVASSYLFIKGGVSYLRFVDGLLTDK